MVRLLCSCRRVSQMDLESASWQMVTLCLDPKRGFPSQMRLRFCMHAVRLVYVMVCVCFRVCEKSARLHAKCVSARAHTHILTVCCNHGHALRACTPQTHAGVYKQTTYHKQTKNQWARDDPAFTGLCFKIRTHACAQARTHSHTHTHRERESCVRYGSVLENSHARKQAFLQHTQTHTNSHTPTHTQSCAWYSY